MWKFAPYVLKTLWGHRARTAMMVGGSAVALFVFCFVGAVQEGLARLTRRDEARRTLIVFQANRFCPSTSRLLEDYAPTIRKNIPGVKDAVPIQLFMNNCRASLDLAVFNGVPADKLRTIRNLKLVSGDWGEFECRTDAAVVGQALARRRNLQVGQRFSVGEVTVVGVFSAPTTAEENFLYSHLEFLQRTRGLNAVGTATQIEVHVEEGADPDAVSRAIDDYFRGGPVQTDTRPKGVFEVNAVGDLAEMIGFARYLGYACVVLVLAMAVQDRVREHALLQTLGFSGLRIFGLVVTEALLVSVAGGLLGVGAALVTLAWSGLVVGTQGVTIAFAPSLSLTLTGLAVAVGVGVLAGLVPAVQAARADILSSLRQE